jgi:hypothetical protein
MLLARCALAWVAYSFLALDESMIRCNSRFCSWRQYLPRKPIKWGIKAYVLACSVGTFCLSWSIYTGKSTTTDEAGDSAGFILKLVTEVLVTPFYDHGGFVLFMDSFFCTIPIFKLLALRGI